MPREVEPQFEIELYYVTETELAVCATEDLDAGDDHWFPKTAVSFERMGTKILLFAPEKMLIDKGLV